VPATIVRDVLVIVPSVSADAVEIVAARARGEVIISRTARRGDELGGAATTLWSFFHSDMHGSHSANPALAPLVFSWLAGRGRRATRLDPHDAADVDALAARLAPILNDGSLFAERLVMLR
jgi:hypothetical protein